MVNPALNLPLVEIAALCRRYQERELALFGSALRDDFHPDSDIDLLVLFVVRSRPKSASSNLRDCSGSSS